MIGEKNDMVDQSSLNELALFAGAGGGILGGKLLGWRTVCAVEWEPYPASVLCARQNDGLLPPFPIWDDVQTFDGHPWRGIVDVISGGFPCQDISAAGKGAGIDGERSGMWGQMVRIIHEVRPRFVFVENSPMLTSRGLGRVLGDLASMGFDARWGVLGAADVGAKHKRNRIWIVAYTNNSNWWREFRGFRGLQECNQKWNSHSTFNQPEPIRMVDGVAARVDRLKAIGNGQVPLCAATAWRILSGDK
jgi:DNA (cytosine-5)-methyltransferase 1